MSNEEASAGTISDSAIFDLRRLTNLRRLELDLPNINNQILASSILLLTDLRVLVLKSAVDESVLTSIASCSRIRKLSFEAAPTPVHLEYLFRALESLPNLEFLSLLESKAIVRCSDIPLPDFQCPLLKTLDLCQNDIGDDGIEAVLSRCPNVEILCMMNLRNVSFQAYEAVPLNCRRLRFLDLSNAPSSLEEFFNEEYVALLTKTYSETLESLSLKVSPSFSDEGFEHFCQLKCLTGLRINYHPGPTVLRKFLAGATSMMLHLKKVEPNLKETYDLVAADFPRVKIVHYPF